jgi:hypothetical protein
LLDHSERGLAIALPAGRAPLFLSVSGSYTGRVYNIQFLIFERKNKTPRTHNPQSFLFSFSAAAAAKLLPPRISNNKLWTWEMQTKATI